MGRYLINGVTQDDDGPIIKAPVSIADVSGVLQASGTYDLAPLCERSNINIWSRRKPVRFNKISALTDLDFYNSYYGFKLNTDNGFNAIFPSLDYSTLDKLFSVHKISSYLKPRGGTYNEQYRLTDFEGYNHEANPLMWVQVVNQRLNISSTVENWLYSLVLEVRHKLMPNNYTDINGLVDGTNHLYPKDANMLQNYVFYYTVNNQKRYRAVEISNTITFNLLLQGDEKIQNGALVNAPQDKFADLYISSLHFDDIDTNNKTLRFGLIMKLKDKYYLYKTNFQLKDLFGQNYTLVPYVDPGNNYVGTIDSQSGYPQILAQSTGSTFTIYIRTWLFNDLIVGTYNNQPHYSISGGNNLFDTLGFVDGDTIDYKLCLYKESSSGSISKYVEEITSSNVQSLNLRSCEFLYNHNVKNSLKYYRIKTSKLPSNSDYVVVKNIDGSVGGRPNNTFSANLIEIRRAAVSGSGTSTIYKYDLVNILRYVQKFNKVAGWFLMAFGSEYSADDDFSGLGGRYYTYTPKLHSDSHTYPNDNKYKVEISFNFNLMSVSSSLAEQGYGYYANNTKITTPLAYVTNNDVCVTVSNPYSPWPTVVQWCTFDKETNPNVSYSDYGNPTEIIYNNSNINYSVNSNHVETKTNLIVGETNASSPSTLDHLYVGLTESNFNDSSVVITVRIPEFVTDDQTMASFTYTSQRLYLKDICTVYTT